jgi:hypothetical protein
MEVVLVHTEGRGGEAVVEVAGRRLTVVDAVSPVEAPTAAGPVDGAVFEAVFVPPDSWERAIAANPDRRRALEPGWGWRYRGYAEIVSTDPVRADLGLLVLELGLPLDSPERLGAFVAIEIDRITLLRSPLSRASRS